MDSMTMTNRHQDGFLMVGGRGISRLREFPE